MSRLALSIDLDRCIGCKSCEAACKQEHGLGPFEYRNKVLWLEHNDTPRVDLLTVTCQQCERPACLRACPVQPKAIVKDPETGVVSVNESRCTGCGECVLACPYGAMGFDPVDHHAVKCDLCASRRSRGESPACASVCPGRAIQFGQRDALLDSANSEQRDVLDQDHYLLGPATVYLERRGASERPGENAHTIALIADPSTRAPLKDAPLATPYRRSSSERVADRRIPGACNICFNGCPVVYHLRGNRVVGVSGNTEDPVFRGRICPKSQMTLQLYDNERRLKTPLKRIGPRGAGRFEPVSWQQALDEIGARLSSLRDEHGPETLAIFSGTRSGIISNGGYLRLFAQMWGTPNTDSTEPLCSSSKNLSFSLVQGARVLANSYTESDIGSAGLYLYIGDNQAETRPVYFGMINDWRKRTGARMVVVDPRMSATATKADEWLAIRSGTDLSLALAMIHHLFTHDLFDRAFCEDWVLGWERWRDFVIERDYSAQWASAITDIAAEKIRALAAEVARADGCMIYASRGINQHSNATQTNRALMFLAAMTGNWGRKGGGFFNISTTHFIGAEAPQQRRTPITRQAVARTPAAWMDHMSAATEMPIRALIASNNPLAHFPSQTKLRKALAELDLMVHLALFENETSAHADYVLPMATGIEKGGVSRAAEERRIVWNEKLLEPPGEAKSDGWFWIELGRRFGFDDVLHPRYVDIATFWDEEITKHPELAGAPVARFLATANRTLRIPLRDCAATEVETLFTEGTRAFGTNHRFPTASGKLEFWSEQQQRAFALAGLSALPEFYSEREQLTPLPYLQPHGEPIACPSLFSAREATLQPVRIVAGNSDNHSANARFDTELITGRPPAAHFHSWTHDFWQAQEMWPDLYVQIHPDKAARHGIIDGDRVQVETAQDTIVARAWVRNGIRESSIFIPIGWGERQPFNPWKGVNHLTDYTQRDPISEQTNFKTRLCRVTRVTS